MGRLDDRDMNTQKSAWRYIFLTGGLGYGAFLLLLTLLFEIAFKLLRAGAGFSSDGLAGSLSDHLLAPDSLAIQSIMYFLAGCGIGAVRYMSLRKDIQSQLD